MRQVLMSTLQTKTAELFMAKQQPATKAITWDEALDVDGNPTVPMEDQAFLLPDDWDPSTTTDGREDLIEAQPGSGSDADGDLVDGDVVSYGWNEKLGRWIEAPSGM